MRYPRARPNRRGYASELPWFPAAKGHSPVRHDHPRKTSVPATQIKTTVTGMLDELNDDIAGELK